jgi:hypothetical protein
MIDIDAAERFLLLNARLIDRLRFARLFRDGTTEAVLAALRAYQNPDGGFGNALEPDLRGAASQPQPVEVAFHLLDELDAFRDPMVGAVVGAACDYLAGITRPGGGVPFVLPSVRATPRAPWWETEDDPPGNLNPTAALAGLLHRNRVTHPWLEGATAFCWQALEHQVPTGEYEVRATRTFLDNVPDRARAAGFLARLPEPDDDLDALAAGQRPDGGWVVGWPAWTPVTEPEWRGWMTVDALRRLQAAGRLP